MTARRGFWPALVLASAAVIAVSGPALADQAKSVQVVAQDGREVQFAVYVDPQASEASSSAVTSTVIVSGAEIPSEASLSNPASSTAEQAMLVLDVSGSMAGTRIAAARQAASSYVESLPVGVDVGLVSFNDVVTEGSPPTQERQRVLRAIAALEAGRKTALFDGIQAGLSAVDPGQGARLLLLSDGGDTASAATVEATLEALRTAAVPVDVVALDPTPAHAALLESLAAASGGNYQEEAEASGLLTAFQQAGSRLGSKVIVRATIPDDIEASGKFAVVSVAVSGVEYQGTTQLPKTSALSVGGVATQSPSVAPASGATAAAGTEDSTSFAWLYALLVAAVAIVLALTIAYSRQQARSRRRVDQVLTYSSGGGGSSGSGPSSTEFDRQIFIPALDAWLSRRSGYSATQAKLDNARLRLTPGSWLILRVGCGLILIFLVAIIIGNLLVALVIGALTAWLVTRMYVNSKETSSRRMFESELPDFLLLLASALRSGLSFSQALDSAARDGRSQVSREIRRALSEAQMGAALVDALAAAAERMDSDDFRWSVAALAIQREVGGNLSTILESAAEMVQGRAALRREVRTLSAEGRLSGWVLAGLPILVFVILLFTNPGYVSYFWIEPIGRVLVVLVVTLFVVGFIWMTRLVRIKV